MSKRKPGRLFEKSCITEKIMLIEDSLTDYISENGNVYKNYCDNLYFKKKTMMNKHNGYIYCGITYPDASDRFKNINKTKRVHKLVAMAFVDNPNPDICNVVGHKNNVKHDNVASNLYWTTTQENTQKAFDDGLAKNDQGFDDSQSKPVDVYIDNKFVETVGSIILCGKKYGIPISTVSRRCKRISTAYRKYINIDFYFSDL